MGETQNRAYDPTIHVGGLQCRGSKSGDSPWRSRTNEYKRIGHAQSISSAMPVHPPVRGTEPPSSKLDNLYFRVALRDLLVTSHRAVSEWN